jgi:hypothetical protein
MDVGHSSSKQDMLSSRANARLTFHFSWFRPVQSAGYRRFRNATRYLNSDSSLSGSNRRRKT